MAILKNAARCALVLGAAACAPDPTIIDSGSFLAVHAVLVAGADSATVHVGTATIHDFGQQARLLPVTDAVVRLVRGADTVQLGGSRPCFESPQTTPDETAASAGCYTAALPSPIQPGASYELLVDVPGTTPIHGTVRVPTAPDVTPTGPLTLYYNDVHDPRQAPPSAVTVQWSSPDAGDHVTLRFVTDRPDCVATIKPIPDSFGTDHLHVTGDSITVAPHSVQCGQQTTGPYPARLLVTAYDRRYSDYLRRSSRGQSLRMQDVSFGLSGAIGVFGAAASTAIPVTLIPR